LTPNSSLAVQDHPRKVIGRPRAAQAGGPARRQPRRCFRPRRPQLRRCRPAHQQFGLQQRARPRLSELDLGRQPAHHPFHGRPRLGPQPALFPQMGQVSPPPGRWLGRGPVPDAQAELHPSLHPVQRLEQRFPAPLQPAGELRGAHHGAGGAGQQRAPLGGGCDHPCMLQGDGACLRIRSRPWAAERGHTALRSGGKTVDVVSGAISQGACPP
jgi:hypothetical protein